MEQIVYSIVIPHYNCPDLLVRCLNSIPEQTDIQVIIADDYSDNREYIESRISSLGRTNVEYHYLDKGWAGHARNIGMSLARGKWIIFCDADDYFTSSAFSDFHRYKDSDADIVYFKHNAAYTDSGKPCLRFPIRNEAIEEYLIKRNEKTLNGILYRDVVPWAKMFRNSFLKRYGFLYDEIRSNEDVMFVVSCNTHASRVEVSKSIVYTITMRPGSLTMSVNRENMFTGFGVAIRYSKFVKSMGHPEYCIRLLSHVRLAYKYYGLKEALRYIKDANNKNISIFSGLKFTIKELISKYNNSKNPDYYNG